MVTCYRLKMLACNDILNFPLDAAGREIKIPNFSNFDLSETFALTKVESSTPYSFYYYTLAMIKEIYEWHQWVQWHHTAIGGGPRTDKPDIPDTPLTRHLLVSK